MKEHASLKYSERKPPLDVVKRVLHIRELEREIEQLRDINVVLLREAMKEARKFVGEEYGDELGLLRAEVAALQVLLQPDVELRALERETLERLNAVLEKYV